MRRYVASAVTLLGMGKVLACTTLLVGNQASADGSFIIARNEDGSANNAKHMVIHPISFHQQGEYRAHRNNFSWPLPETAMRYTAIHDFDTNDNAMGEAGFNSAGVGMSATETIYNGKAALAADPYVAKTGITEDAIETVILPVAQSARQGAKLLGDMIEQKAQAKVSASLLLILKRYGISRREVVINGWRYDCRQINISFPQIRDVYAVTIRMIKRIIWRRQR